MNSKKAIAVFQGKKIRKTWHKEEWWFALEDIVGALTESTDVKQYINKLRQRDEELSKGWGQIVHTLSVPTLGGNQKMNCVNTEGAFRIIQSIPSPKAEPFKLWLAKVGKERFFNKLMHVIFRMFPSDPKGSLDAFYFSLGVDFCGRNSCIY